MGLWRGARGIPCLNPSCFCAFLNFGLKKWKSAVVFFFLTFTTACASLHLDAKPCAEPLVLALAAGRSTLGGFNPLFYPPCP